MSIKKLSLALLWLSQSFLLGCFEMGKERLRIEVPVSPGRETALTYQLPKGKYQFFVFCDRKGGAARDAWEVEYVRRAADDDRTIVREERRGLSADENTIWLEEVEARPGSSAGEVSVLARSEGVPQGSTLALVIQDSRVFK